MKQPVKKLSKQLSKRTKLSPSQLERVRGQAGGGLASRYNDNGEQSLTLTRRLAKAAKKARRFILYSDELGKRVYVSSEIADIPLTFDKANALLFFEGFDDPQAKVVYWNKRIQALKFITTHN